MGPPERCPGSPVTVELAAGTVLIRVHSNAFAPTEFNRTPAPGPERGGRFDSLDGSYGYLYAGADHHVAIAEALLREVEAPATGPRQLPFRVVEGKSLSSIETTQELLLVSLKGADLGQVGQDVWLTKCPATDYVETRRWAAAIRGWAPEASGFLWRSRRDEDRLAYVLFEDRTPAGTLRSRGETVAIDRGPGLVRVRKALLRHNVVLQRGRP